MGGGGADKRERELVGNVPFPIIRELLLTEIDYRTDLGAARSLYLEPLAEYLTRRTSSKVSRLYIHKSVSVLKGEVRSMLGQVSLLQKLHRFLARDLVSAAATAVAEGKGHPGRQTQALTLVAVANTLKKHSAFLKIYNQYCVGYRNFSAHLADALKSDRATRVKLQQLEVSF